VIALSRLRASEKVAGNVKQAGEKLKDALRE